MKSANGFFLIVVSLALLMGIPAAQAHDPFDSSSRMTVLDSGLEISITLGLDAARRVLSSAGFSKEKIAELVQARGPKAIKNLPASIATNFFMINFQGKNLVATNAAVLSEGLEIIFTLRYPRPPAGRLRVRATFYEQIQEMQQGSFIAVDENANTLGSALLSRSRFTAQVAVPALKSAADSNSSHQAAPRQ